MLVGLGGGATPGRRRWSGCSLSQALPDLMNAPHRFCVVVTQQEHAQLVSELAAASRNEIDCCFKLLKHDET